MRGLLGLGALAMIGADTVVGVRLLLLAWRTRELPETTLGLAFLLLGAIGYPLATAARRELLPTDAGNAALMAAGLLAQNLACLAMYLNTAATFRAGARWARVLGGAAAAGLAASYAGQAAATRFAPHATGVAYYLGLAIRAGAFAWSASEGLRYYTRARRRLRLGLADPVVTNRFLLFGLGTAGVFAAFVIFWIGQLTTANVAESTWVLAATSVVGIVSAVATWLAFLPPAAYLRRIQARAPH